MKTIIIQDTKDIVQAVVPVDPVTGLPVASGTGSGTASMDNQILQVAAEQAILAKLNTNLSTGSSAQVVITRSANVTPYVVGGAIGAASAIYETAVLGAPNSEFIITRADLYIRSASLPSGIGGFTLHLFNSAPTAIADNAVVGTTITTVDLTKRQGEISIGTPVDKGNYCASPDNAGLMVPVKLSSTGTLFTVLETPVVFTPTSGAIKEIHLHGIGV